MIITTLSIRTDGTVQSLISPGPTIRSVHVQNLTPVMVIVRDGGGSIYRVTAGQTTRVSIQPCSSIDVYTEIATVTGRATITAYDDMVIDTNTSSAGGLSGRGNWYDRITRRIVWERAQDISVSVGTVTHESYTVPIGKMAMFMYGRLSLSRSGMALSAAEHQLLVRVFALPNATASIILSAIMPAWDRVSSQLGNFRRRIWTDIITNIGPFTAGDIIELQRIDGGSDILYVEYSVFIMEFDA